MQYHLIQRSRFNRLPLLVLLISLCGLCASAAPQQDPDDENNPRRVLDPRFRKSRPPSRSLPPTSQPATKRPNAKPSVTTKTENSAAKPSGKPSTERIEEINGELVGVTIWRLRAASDQDPESAPRELFQEDGQQLQYVYERADSKTGFREGDRLRLSVEYPRAGRFYLYVIDREEYRDGTLGPPTLIYPSKSTPEDGNLLAPGRALSLPAYNDPRPFFRLRRNPRRQDQVSERLTLIISQSKLTLGNGELVGPLKLEEGLVAQWEQDGGARAAKEYEMPGGAGRPRTREEKDADVNSKDLDQVAPLPQTAYEIRANVSGKVSLIVLLKIAP